MFWKRKKKIAKENIMTVENFRGNFPPDENIPASLLALFEYQVQKSLVKKFQYSGYFYLYDNFWKVPWKRYFDDESTSYFIPFGSTADGSIYAFWQYKELQLEKCPIIFLGFSWTGTTIVADNINDFLALLTVGAEELGYSVPFPGWPDHTSDTPEIILFRSWMENELGISVPKNPEELIQKSRDNHPDLGDWTYQRINIPPDKFSTPPWEW